VLLLTALAHAIQRHDAVWELCIAAALGLAYSLSPLRLSRRPVLDMMANALGYGCIAFLLAQPTATWNPVLLSQLLTGGLAVSAVFLHTTLLDLTGDAQAGKRSTGIWLGPQQTRRLALTCAIAAAVTGAFAAAPHLFAACGALVILSLFAESRRVSILGTAAFAIAATIASWWFGIGLALLVITTRTYYKQRFNLLYPAF
jgi:1,4-dihydroxy-2-naphthoate octaprenyltransferase